MKILSSHNHLRMANGLNKNQALAMKAVERLASGKNINKASDDPSKVLRLSRLEAQKRGSQVAQGNIQDGITLAQTASHSLDHVRQMGQRLRDLSVQYGNESLNDQDRSSIEKEASSLLKEMHTTIKDTTFNGIHIFEKDRFTIQTGANSRNQYDLYMNKYNFLDLHEEKELIAHSASIAPEVKTAEGEERVGEGTQSIQSRSFGTTSIVDRIKDKVESIWDRIFGKPSKPEKPEVDPPACPPNETDPVEDPDPITPPTDEEIKEWKIEDVLNPDFIDQQFLNPLSQALVNIGIHESALERRLDLEIGKEQLHEQTLSNIQDVDIARELIAKTKHDLLASTNSSLLFQNLDSQRAHVLNLLG